MDSDAYSENDEESVPGEDEVLTLLFEAAALVLFFIKSTSADNNVSVFEIVL